jgi:hypothetical protein
MRRLVFLLPNVDVATQIVEEVTVQNVSRDNIHIIAKHGVSMGNLPDAHVPEETSDFFPAYEKGLAIGGVTGLLAGLVALAFPPSGIVLGGGAIIATTVAGAGLGALMSAIVGSDLPDSHLKRYEEGINAGEILMMIDVPTERIEEIEASVKTHHPEADVRGVDPLFPPL